MGRLPGKRPASLWKSVWCAMASALACSLLLSGCPKPPEIEPAGAWPGASNSYSWDGSWTPEQGDLPPEGLYDIQYCDGHLVNGQPSPILPPGAWDWTSETGSVAVLASWNMFRQNIGTFGLLEDDTGNAFGWVLTPAAPQSPLINYFVDPFHGSAGVDVLNLGLAGRIAYTGGLRLGDGPDMVYCGTAAAADWRTGSSETGSLQDNDLAVLGGASPLPAGQFDIMTSTVHCGPGRDLVYVTNIGRAAVDLGNGENGRTDALDPHDGGDMAVIAGNAYDFRIFGAKGPDTIVWLVDQVNQDTPWLGPNIYGAGGWDEAKWDCDTDRLVLGVPVNTPVLSNPGAPTAKGTVTLRISPDYPDEPVVDGPTEQDPYARYQPNGGIGPNGAKTVTLEYVNLAGTVKTGYSGITSIEELQIGIGPDAPVYAIDQTTGEAALDADAEPLSSLPSREELVALIETFAASR